MNQFISLADIDDLESLIREARGLKANPPSTQVGKGKTLGMLFFNPSLRTRLSTEKAAKLLGMEVMMMNIDKDGWKLEFEDGAIMNGDKAEHIKEAAAVLSQYCNIIAVRAFPDLKKREKDYSEVVLNGFRKYASVPIVNLESATGHPLQAVADAISIQEFNHEKRPKIILSWAPHPKALPQSVANSFVELMQRLDVDFTITNPEGYDLNPEIRKDVKVEHDQEKALENADFVYVKNWSSYEDYGKVLEVEKNWMINAQKMNLTNKAKLMHCLPVRRNVVIADEVLDSEDSIVIQQANNRTYAALVILKRLIETRYKDENLEV